MIGVIEMNQINPCEQTIPNRQGRLPDRRVRKPTKARSRAKPRNHGNLRRQDKPSQLGRPRIGEGRLFPLQWTQYLVNFHEIDGVRVLADLPEKTQVQLAAMVWFDGQTRRLHKRHQSGQKPLYCYHHKELDQVFGKGKFHRLNTRLKLFHVQKHYWDCGHGFTRAYCLTESAANLKREFAAYIQGKPIDLISQSGRLVKTLFSGILGRRADRNPNRLWKNIAIKSLLPVDRAALHELKLEIQKLRAQSTSARKQSTELRYKLDLADHHANVILITANNKIQPGHVPMIYQEYTSGRLYSTGINLQNCVRAVRMAALWGAIDVDIQNCHPTLLEILYEQIEPNEPLRALKEYNANPKEFQARVANELQVTRSQVKKALIALLYGASLSSSPECSLSDFFSSKDMTQQFIKNPDCVALVKDFRTASIAISDDARNKASRGSIMNMAGCWLKLSDTSNHTVTSHILQGIEAVILKECIDYCSHLQHSFILLQHDGFSIDCSIDVDALSNHVFYRLGLRVTFTTKELDFRAELAAMISETQNHRTIDQSQFEADSGVSDAR